MFIQHPSTQFSLFLCSHRHHYLLQIQSLDIASVHECVILGMHWSLHFAYSLHGACKHNASMNYRQNKPIKATNTLPLYGKDAFKL